MTWDEDRLLAAVGFVGWLLAAGCPASGAQHDGQALGPAGPLGASQCSKDGSSSQVLAPLLLVNEGLPGVVAAEENSVIDSVEGAGCDVGAVHGGRQDVAPQATAQGGPG